MKKYNKLQNRQRPIKNLNFNFNKINKGRLFSILIKNLKINNNIFFKNYLLNKRKDIFIYLTNNIN